MDVNSGLLTHVSQLQFFKHYGGIALGLSLTKLICDNSAVFQTPDFWIIPLRGLTKNMLQTYLLPCAGKRVVVKESNHLGDFSIHSRRGVGSSRKRKPIIVSEKMSVEDLLQGNVPNQTVALVLQEFVKIPDALHAIVHADAEGVLAEITYGPHKYLLNLDQSGSLNWQESTEVCRGISTIEEVIEPIAFMREFLRLQQVLGFPVNVECFFNREIVSIIQLRPVPYGEPYSERLAEVIPQINAAFRTRFVWGVFDFQTVLRSEEDALTFVDEPVLAVLRRSIQVPWLADYFRLRLARGLHTLVIDATAASTLSHDPDKLPECVNTRVKFNRIHVPPQIGERLLGKYLRFMSDGHFGIISGEM